MAHEPVGLRRPVTYSELMDGRAFRPTQPARAGALGGQCSSRCGPPPREGSGRWTWECARGSWSRRKPGQNAASSHRLIRNCLITTEQNSREDRRRDRRRRWRPGNDAGCTLAIRRPIGAEQSAAPLAYRDRRLPDAERPGGTDLQTTVTDFGSQAARQYSWSKPPRRSIRSIPSPVSNCGMAGLGTGWSRSMPLWGRSWL